MYNLLSLPERWVDGVWSNA